MISLADIMIAYKLCIMQDFLIIFIKEKNWTMFSTIYGKDTIDKLGIKEIEPNSINLSKSILKDFKQTSSHHSYKYSLNYFI
jgi:hypothetical protein